MHSIGLKLASKPTCEVLSSCLCSSTHCAHTVPEHFVFEQCHWSWLHRSLCSRSLSPQWYSLVLQSRIANVHIGIDIQSSS